MAHLERLHKGPEKNSNGVTLTEEFDEPRRSEEAEEAQVDEVILGKRRKRVTIQPLPGAQSCHHSQRPLHEANQQEKASQTPNKEGEERKHY